MNKFRQGRIWWSIMKENRKPVHSLSMSDKIDIQRQCLRILQAEELIITNTHIPVSGTS